MIINNDVSLTVGTAADPVAGPGEVVVDIAAAGVNRADLLQVRGGYPPPAGESDIVGLECAGVISELGADVADWAVGDRVCALLAGGGYAERVVVPATQLLPVPAGLTLIEAAGLPEVAATVWSNLVMIGRMRAGHRVLVHGGSSGIGTMAIQVARELGAFPIATAGTVAKVAASREIGAGHVINYRQEDFVDEVLSATDGRGADLILDVVGADYMARNIAALADGGRIIVIGLLGGARGELNLGALMAKRAGIIGTALRSRPRTGPGSKAEIIADVRRHMWPLIESGAIRPVIGGELKMEEADQAHARLRDGTVIGKIVLQGF